MRWLAIRDASDAPRHPRPLPPQPIPALLGTGTLIVELALQGAPARPQAILDYRAHQGWERALGLTLGPDGVLRFHQQQGPGRADIALRLTLPRGMHGLRLTYTWNAPARRARLSAEILHGGRIVSATTATPMPLPAEDVHALFAPHSGAIRHPGVTWMALSSDEMATDLGAAVTAATPIRTPQGQVRADALRAGDLVTTRDHGPQPLRRVGTLVLPAQGSFTPVRLRAPYFSTTQDLIVAPAQRLALSGAEVEYLFGEDEVLAGARHFLNGRSALLETRRALVTYVFLLFDRHEVILAADCPIESLHHDGVDPIGGGLALRALDDYEAISLRHMVERADRMSAA